MNIPTSPFFERWNLIPLPVVLSENTWFPPNSRKPGLYQIGLYYLAVLFTGGFQVWSLFFCFRTLMDLHNIFQFYITVFPSRYMVVSILTTWKVVWFSFFFTIDLTVANRLLYWMNPAQGWTWKPLVKPPNLGCQVTVWQYFCSTTSCLKIWIYRKCSNRGCQVTVFRAFTIVSVSGCITVGPTVPRAKFLNRVQNMFQ